MAEQHGKTLVPEIRFSGFTDPWEQRKLGEVAPLQRGFDLPVSQMISGPYPVVMSNGVGGWHSKYAVKGPGVVTGRSGTIGGLQYIEGDFWPHNTSLWVTSFNSNEPKFIYWLYSSLNLERFGSGSGVPTLNRNDVHDQLIGVPCNIAEQRRIGAFFDRLDSLITLHQRKYDKLCVLKKSMLDKMFPKGGSLYPEIRFSGFTDPWEQRKLGELYQKNDERNTDGLGSERTLSVASMTFNSTGNGADESSLPSYKRLRLGDIAFEGHANKEFAYGRFVLNDAGNGIMSPRFTCLRPIVEQEYSFWKYFIHSEEVMRPILVNSTKSGTMMNELVVKDFLEQEILVPSLPEQRQIGAFFDCLDSLITLHQRKLELLRNIKKSMLDKMFV